MCTIGVAYSKTSECQKQVNDLAIALHAGFERVEKLDDLGPMKEWFHLADLSFGKVAC